MQMDKYLQQILHEINTIIIPGLGALTVTKKETGEVMFMPFLKHDDGNLSKIIAEKEGVPENDAKNLIAKYVREITAKLGKGESYDMFQFGRFIKIDGEPTFENWNQYQHTATELNPIELIEEPTLEAILESKPEEKTIEAIKEKEVEETNETSTPETTTSPKVAEPALKEESSDDIINKILTKASAIKPDENIYISKEEVEKIEKIQEQKTAEPKKPEAKGNSKIAKDQKNPNLIKIKKKKSIGFWLLVILLPILVGGGVSGFIFKDHLLAFFGQKKEVVATVDEKKPSEAEQEAMEEQVELASEEKETSEETTPTTETVETPAPVETPTEENTSTSSTYDASKPFHIIVGGFGVEGNANRFAKKFQDEGKKAQVLGKFDDKFLVSYESFATKEEANAALKNMPIDGWVFKYQK
jgi:septal ring-binding cell division protein DamX